MSIELKRARPIDAGRILRLLELMHDEAPADLGPIHEAKAMTAIVQAIAEGFVLLAVDGDRLAGAIGGVRHADWWTVEAKLADMFFYVRPQFRQSRAAILLITAFKEFADNAGLKLKMGPMTGEDLDRKAALYERLGLMRTGLVFTPPKQPPEEETT